MEEKFSHSSIGHEEVDERRQTETIDEGETLTYCQGSGRTDVGEKNAPLHDDQCSNIYTRPPFSDPNNFNVSMNKTDSTSTTCVEQKRVSRRDEHERTTTLHSSGQLRDGLSYINKKSDFDNLILTSQNTVR